MAYLKRVNGCGWQVLASLIPLVLLAWLFYDVSFVWRLGVNYRHGYMIPLLCLVVGYVLWPNRPEASGRGLGLVKGVALLGLLLSFIPLRIVFEVNPDWRLLMWVEAFQVLLVCVVMVSVWGGWSWVRYFSVIGGMVLLALPWPTRVESALLSGMMSFVSNRTVEVLHFLGQNAWVKGDLVSVNGTIVGISEACSGLKSFQMTLLVVVILFGIWRYRRWGGLFVILGSLFFCLMVNLLRVIMLSLIVAEYGKPGLDRWHDPIGFMATAGILLVLVGIGWSSRVTAIDSESEETERAEKRERIDIYGNLSPRWVMMMTGLLLFSSVSPVVFYGIHPIIEGRLPRSLNLNWQNLDGFEAIPIDPTFEEQLWFDEAIRGRTLRGGHLIEMYSFYWKPGRVSAFSMVHRPENCLPAVGYTFQGLMEPFVYKVEGYSMFFHPYRFSMGTQSFYVFYAGLDLTSGEDLATQFGLSDRWKAVSQQRRFGARQSMQIIIVNDDYIESKATLMAIMEQVSGSEG